MTLQRCDRLIPTGWYCSRGRGHDGPCAARPVTQPGVATWEGLIAERDAAVARAEKAEAARLPSYRAGLRGLMAERDDLKAECDALSARLREAEAERDHLRGRGEHFARVLGVTDNGIYRNDWDTHLERLLARSGEAERLIERLSEYAPNPSASLSRARAFLSACLCHYCGLPVVAGEKAIEAKSGNGWAHFTCWFDGGPFEREQRDRSAAPTEGTE